MVPQFRLKVCSPVIFKTIDIKNLFFYAHNNNHSRITINNQCLNVKGMFKHACTTHFFFCDDSSSLESFSQLNVCICIVIHVVFEFFIFILLLGWFGRILKIQMGYLRIHSYWNLWLLELHLLHISGFPLVWPSHAHHQYHSETQACGNCNDDWLHHTLQHNIQ